MGDIHAGAPRSLSDYAAVIRATPWPVAVLATNGQILVASPLIAVLLGAAQPEGHLIETLLAPEDHIYIRAILKQVLAGGGPALARVHVLHAGILHPIEIELMPSQEAGERCVTAVFYGGSVAEQRDRAILGLNLLVPTLMRASSFDEAYQRVAATIPALGFGVNILLLEDDGVHLRLAHHSSAPAYYALLAAVMGHAQLGRLSADLPMFREVLREGKAYFHPTMRPFHEAFFPKEAADLNLVVQRLCGIRGFIHAPLVIEGRVCGILGLWGHLFGAEDTPFIAAFVQQLGGALAQIDLRRRMEQQIQRLNSLATTARAVTTLGALDEVLLVVCQQAQELLGAEYVGASLLSPDRRSLVVEMNIGRWATQLRGKHYPVSNSLAGRAL